MHKQWVAMDFDACMQASMKHTGADHVTHNLRCSRVPMQFGTNQRSNVSSTIYCAVYDCFTVYIPQDTVYSAFLG